MPQCIIDIQYKQQNDVLHCHAFTKYNVSLTFLFRQVTYHFNSSIPPHGEKGLGCVKKPTLDGHMNKWHIY